MRTYRDVKRQLEDRICGGGYRDDSFLTRIDDICVEFQVARMTASRAVRSLQEEGVVYAKQGNGVFVKDVGLLLDRRSRTEYVGLCGKHFFGSSSPYFSYRNEAVHNYFQGRGIGVRHLPSLSRLADETGLKGVLVDYHYWRELKGEFARLSLPVVAYNNPADTAVASVNWDNEALVALAAGHFKERGLDSLTLVVEASDPDGLAERFRRRFPGEVTVMHYTCCSLTEGVELGRRLCGGRLPKGLYVGDDFVCNGLLMSLQRARVDIPGDISLLLGASPRSQLAAELGLPVVGCDPERVGAAAAALLHRLINGEQPTGMAVAVAPELVVPDDNSTANIFRGAR